MYQKQIRAYFWIINPSSDIDSGAYGVLNNTITFAGNNGATKNLLFFFHDHDVNDVQLGEKNNYVDD